MNIVLLTLGATLFGLMAIGLAVQAGKENNSLDLRLAIVSLFIALAVAAGTGSLISRA